jgi:Lipid A 3-O-deacylase (PagL)
MRWGTVAWVLWVAAVARPAAAVDAPIGVQLQAGVSRALNSGRSREVGLELELPPERYGLYPVLGVVVAEDRSGHVYLGVARDFRLARGWSITALTGVAAYHPGDTGIDLGGVAQFRSSLALSVQWSESLRLALVLSHLSNAGLRETNPGTESLSLGVRWHR